MENGLLKYSVSRSLKIADYLSEYFFGVLKNQRFFGLKQFAQDNYRLPDFLIEFLLIIFRPAQILP